MKLSIILVFAYLILVAGCRKEEVLLTGDISGRILTYNEQNIIVQDGAGINVDLYKKSVKIQSTVTDTFGRYQFEDIPYGRYTLDCYSDRYVKPWNLYPLFHVGGASSTDYDVFVEEIPEFELFLDSVGIFSESNYSLEIHLKFNGDTVLPLNIFYFRTIAFFSNSPGVTKDNYSCRVKGILTDFGPNYEIVAAFGILPLYEINNFNEIKDETIYVVMYPITFNQGYNSEEYYPRALGKPSNEISFNLNELK